MSSKFIKLTALTFFSISLFAQAKKSFANSFSEKEIDQQQIIAVAVPFGYKEHNLEIIEQIPNQQQCWDESGTAPVIVDLLLLSFDYADSCKLSKDTNGYSVRLDGNDDKSSLYLIQILQRNGELQVIAKHEDPSLPELIIGRSKGLGEGALKIDLEPGWKITKRSYEGKALSHVYLSGNSQLIGTNPQNPKIIPKIPAPPNTPISEALPNLIPESSPEEKQMRDDRPGSDTEGLIIVRDRIKIAFEEDTTVEEANSVLERIEGDIAGSFEGGTIVTVQIPDTGNLDRLRNVEEILTTEPSVLTTAPIIVDMYAAPEPPGQAFVNSSLNLTPAPACNSGENIPLYLQVTGAFDSSGNRPQPIGNSPVNIFVFDSFSSPNHLDLNLNNPLFGNANLDPDGDQNVALFNNPRDQNDPDGNPNDHGFLVGGVLSARGNNNCGVIGMYPDNNANIFAVNATRTNSQETLLSFLQNTPGNHVVNISRGHNWPRNTPPQSRLVDDRDCTTPGNLNTCALITSSNILNERFDDASRELGMMLALEIRQRQLEDRVIFVNSAGNNSDRSRNLIQQSGASPRFGAAGLRTDMSQHIERREFNCRSVVQKIGGALGRKKEVCDEIYTNRDVAVPPLENFLVAEALEAVSGDHANYSNEVDNADVRTRAFGDVFATCPINNTNTQIGFPALANNGQVVCMIGGGTSSAAPQVAGLAAWLWSRESNLTASEVVNRIRNNQTEFQRLDSAGNFDTDSSSGNPIMSTEEAINVVETLKTPGLALNGCASKELGQIEIADNDFGAGATTLPINGNGIILPGSEQPQDIKPALEEFGHDPNKFLSGDYGDFLIEIDYNFDGTVEYVWLSKVPESCS